MSSKIKVAQESELEQDGQRIIEEIEGQEIAVFRHDGEYFALANYCVHQSGPLCEGGLTGQTTTEEDNWDWSYDPEEKYIRCPWHGWTYDITTGTSVKDDSYSIPSYDVEVENGEVFILL
jgi:nitrite reductase/ring-hydroxylating ferredoxin subunit